MDRIDSVNLKRRRFNVKGQLLRWGVVVMLLAMWEIGVRLDVIDPFYVSAPSRILRHGRALLAEGILIRHLSITLSEAAAGLILGLLLGMITGFLFASSPRVDAFLQPFLIIINALPRIAFAPLIILWFGLGFTSKVVIVVSLVYFIVFFNTYRGFKEVSPILLKNARVLGAQRRQILYHIYLPATMSWTFASIRTSVGFAIIAAILGEYIGASAGIGYLIDNAQSQFDATGVMTGLAILTLVVAALDPVLRWVEGYFLKWHINVQPPGGKV
jgi:NitT/TauT family transport system permease protein